MSEIGERVKKIVVEHLGVEPEKVVDNASFIDDLGDDSLDDGLDCLLLHIGQHAQDHLPATLDQAEDGWLVLRQRAAARRACQPAAAAKPPPLATAAG